MKDREKRRERDYNYGARARAVHLRRVHPDGVVDCICEQSAWFFRKAKSVGCRCRRKKKGNPKVARGMCHGLRYHPSLLERVAGRRLCRGWEEWVRGCDPDDFDDGKFVKKPD